MISLIQLLRRMANEYGSDMFIEGTHGHVDELDSMSLYECAKGNEYTWYKYQLCCPGLVALIVIAPLV